MFGDIHQVKRYSVGSGLATATIVLDSLNLKACSKLKCAGDHGPRNRSLTVTLLACAYGMHRHHLEGRAGETYFAAKGLNCK